MLINISELINNKISRQEINVEFNKEKFWDGSEYVNYSKPIKITGTFRRDEDIIIFTGNLRTELVLTCSRCLEKFNYSVDLDLREKFARTKDEDDDVNILRESKINFEPIIESNIIFQLPIKRLCNGNCKGLCTKCGNNLNYNHCNCDIEYEDEVSVAEDNSIDPRLAKLRDLFKDNQ